ncbi:MAG: ABC-F type ribosomal protection protein [Clostridiales bacterium]|nr:ABC-F type ribosomal protection protein [Clostridiales bacterium]
MSIIRVENLTFSYPTNYENIFDNVSFSIDTDWKLGFVGRNGRGKTTFLNLLQGKYEYEGNIVSSVKFDYFPYSVRDKSSLTEDVLKEVCPTTEEWRIIRELSYLDVDCDVLYRPFCTLSNGEQTKVLLAALFLNEGHFLLIDEPTNHLDARSRETLSDYLRKKKSFILVSHDRCFMDGCVDHILSINRANIEVQSGNLSSFLTNFERQQDFERRENDRLKTDIKRLQESAKQTSHWADLIEASKIGAADKGAIGHRAAKMAKRAKVIEARQQREIEQKSKLLKNAEYENTLKLSPLVYRSERLVSFAEVSPVYDGKVVCPPVTFEIKRGDRIALDGKNGSGKSSILKLLCGQEIMHTGEVNIGSNLVISYVPQDTSHLQGTLKDFAASNKIDESLFKTILIKTGFKRLQFEKDMSEFSEGQKKKTLIAKSLCEKAHLYVWDEPLNYIDIYSRMQIEDLLDECRPTMIFVEHDKAFRDNIATNIIKL